MNNELKMIQYNKSIGFQWMIDTGSNPDSEGRVQFKFNTFPYINPKKYIKLVLITYTENTPAPVVELLDQYKKHNGEGADDISETCESNLIIGYPFTRGAGFFRIRIDKFICPDVAGANMGFTIALVNKDIDKQQIFITDIKYGINLPHVGSDYKIYHDGEIYTPTTVLNPLNISEGGANNDVVEIRRNNNKYQLVVYQAGTTTILEEFIIDEEYPYGTDEILYPVIMFGGTDTDLILSRPRVHLDPFISIEDSQHDELIFADDELAYGTTEPLLPPSELNLVSSFKLKFNFVEEDNWGKIISNGDYYEDIYLDKFKSPDTTHYDIRKSLQRFLGFQSNSYTIPAVLSSSFVADNVFMPNFISKVYYLECQNLKLDSYTSVADGEKNILLPLAIQDNSSYHQISYEPNNLYMVNLYNTYELPMQTFRFRLLNSDLSPVSVIGRSSMTVLID
jgi:hypothetical protein